MGKSPGAMVIIGVGADLTITSWNARAEEAFKIGSAEAVGRGITEVLPLAGEAESWQTLRAVVGDAAPRVWPVRRGEAVLRFEAWTEAQDAGFALFGHDATARVEAELRNRMEATMLQAVKDNLDIVITAMDRTGTFIYQDGKGLVNAGLKPHQFVGANAFDLYSEETGTNEVRRALAGEATYKRPSAAHGQHWDTWFIPMSDNPTRAAVVCLTLDVTDSKRVELDMRAKLDLIERQQEVIRELATPIIEVWDGVLTMPIVGLVDTNRTGEIMDSLLQAVTNTRARYAILDLTGVEVVDTNTASHLIKMIQAIKLLGAEGILSGIHPSIAQTMVAIGVDLSRVAVFAKLRDALKHCLSAAR